MNLPNAIGAKGDIVLGDFTLNSAFMHCEVKGVYVGLGHKGLRVL